MNNVSFEENMKQLDGIVKKLESGELTLEEMLSSFEEGIKLSKICNQQLTEAEGKVNILLKNGEEMTNEEFKGLPEV